MSSNNFVLFELIERLGNLIRAEFRRAGNFHNLQAVHIQALLYLQQANRYSNTPIALTEYLGLTKGTVSQSLMVLERSGLIQRFADEKDKRISRFSLTDTGQELLSGMKLPGKWQTVSQSSDETQLATAINVLQEILRGLQAVNKSKTFGVCKTCRYFDRGPEADPEVKAYQCGLTGESLDPHEIIKICREHTLLTVEEQQAAAPPPKKIQA